MTVLKSEVEIEQPNSVEEESTADQTISNKLLRVEREILDRENLLAIMKIGAEIEGEIEIDMKIEEGNGQMISITPHQAKETPNLVIIEEKITEEKGKIEMWAAGQQDIMKRLRQYNKKGSQEKFETNNHIKLG